MEKYIIETIEYELSTVDGVKKVGASKLEVWEKLVFHLVAPFGILRAGFCSALR